MSESTTRKKFVDYQLAEDVQEGIRRMGFDTPTRIQELCIPPVLDGRDVVGKAETGTGKTLGFAAPLVGKVDTQRVATQALVLTPTRELAKQVAEVVEELGKGRDLAPIFAVGSTPDSVSTKACADQLSSTGPGASSRASCPIRDGWRDGGLHRLVHRRCFGG